MNHFRRHFLKLGSAALIWPLIAEFGCNESQELPEQSKSKVARKPVIDNEADSTDQHHIPLADFKVLAHAFGLELTHDYFREFVFQDLIDTATASDFLIFSPLTVGVDWRDVLPEVIERVSKQMAVIGILLNGKMNGDRITATISFGSKSCEVKFDRYDDEDDIRYVFTQINKLVADKAEYRILKDSEELDVYFFGLLRNEKWASLEKQIPNTIAKLFVMRQTWPQHYKNA